MTAERTCDLPPFVSPVVAQVATLEQAGSSLEILTQTLENYLAIFKAAICEDLTQIVEECCGSTAQSFLDLSDTPDTYAGSAGYNVVVNAGATGLEFQAQPDPPETFLTKKFISLLKPNGTIGVTAMLIGSGQAIQAGTTNSNVQPAATNFRTQFPRWTSTSSAAANQNAGWRNSNLLVYRGDAAGRGGFTFKARFATGTALANQRLFCGLNNPIGQLTANPSGYTNVIGMGMDSADANYSIVHNDAAGAATMVPLGSGFPKNTTSVYELTISCQPNASTVEWEVTNLETGATASGVISTELPANTLFFECQTMVGNGGTASAAVFDHIYVLLEHAT